MKKSVATILSLCVLTAAIGSPTVSALAPKTRTAQASTATYRCSAIAEGYTAVSHGSTLYLFNEENGGFWQEYTHAHPVTKLDFDDNGNLYFLDDVVGSKLYKLPVADYVNGVQPETVDVSFDTFLIDGEYLYGADVGITNTTIFKRSLSDESTQTYTFPTFYKAFDYADGTLYALSGADELHALTMETQQATAVAQFPSKSNAFALAGDRVFITTDDGSLYTYDLTRAALSAEQTGSYTALSAHADSAYFLNGDVMQAATDEGAIANADGEFLLPTLEKIPTEDLQTELATGSGGFKVVETKKNALLVEVQDEGTPYFTYRQSLRSQPIRGLQIAKRSGYALIAYRESLSDDYKTYLVDERLVASAEESVLVYDAEKTVYLTNAVALYKFPHLELSTLTTLKKDEGLTAVGEIQGLDCDYYVVRYGESTGYIPKAYATANNARPPEGESLTAGDVGRDTDAIWRMAYLLLGAGAICILTDFLILRKKRED